MVLALQQEMERDRSVVVLGEDVGVNGGVFHVTEGLHAKFGKERVIDTPLAEAAIVETAIGMALMGVEAVAEIQFSGFAFLALGQIEGQAARYRWRTQALTYPQSSGCPTAAASAPSNTIPRAAERWSAHLPGLRLMLPRRGRATPRRCSRRRSAIPTR